MTTALRVWVYPDKTWEDFGAERWSVEWETLTDAAQKRADTDPDYEADFDFDIEYNTRAFKTRDAARRFAKRIYGHSFFGQARVQKQAVDWYVEEDRIAEWADVGEPEYVD